MSRTDTPPRTAPSETPVNPDHWTEVGELLASLYRIVERLEVLFPGRKFTPDGHLVGSIGEVIAARMFWTAPGLLDTRVRVFDLMRPPQLERVFPALPGPAFGSRSPRESNDGCTGS